MWIHIKWTTFNMTYLPLISVLISFTWWLQRSKKTRAATGVTLWLLLKPHYRAGLRGIGQIRVGPGVGVVVAVIPAVEGSSLCVSSRIHPPGSIQRTIPDPIAHRGRGNTTGRAVNGRAQHLTRLEFCQMKARLVSGACDRVAQWMYGCEGGALP